MSSISESAIKALPRKPLNGYFKFRGEKLLEYKDDENRATRVKKEWDGLSEAVRAKLDEAYKLELENYKKDLDEWKLKYKLDDDDIKNIKGREKSLKKVEKSKGKASKEVEKKKETKNEKDASKSKEKGDKGKDAKVEKKNEAAKENKGGKDAKKDAKSKGKK